MPLTDDSICSCYYLSELFSKEMPVQKWTLGCLFIEVMITVELMIIVELSVSKC